VRVRPCNTRRPAGSATSRARPTRSSFLAEAVAAALGAAAMAAAGAAEAGAAADVSTLRRQIPEVSENTKQGRRRRRQKQRRQRQRQRRRLMKPHLEHHRYYEEHR